MKSNFIRLAVFACLFVATVLFVSCQPVSQDGGYRGGGSSGGSSSGSGNSDDGSDGSGGSPTSIESLIPGTYVGNGYALLFRSDKTGNITCSGSGNIRSASPDVLQTGEFNWSVSSTTVTIKMKDSSTEYRATYSTGKLTIDGNDYKVDIKAPATLVEWRALSEYQISVMASNLPAFDARNYGVVPNVTNQGGYSLCWVYGSISASEISMLKEGFNPYYTSDNLRLSEENIAWRCVNKTTNRLPGLNPETFSSADFDRGRAEANVENVFTQWNGPIETKQLPNDTFRYSGDDYVPPLLEEAGHLPPLNKGDKKMLKTYKEYVLKYGALSIGHRYSGSASNDYYNSDGSNNLEHGVAIVGWDDTISKDKFRYNVPSQDGAWLIRDSWGAGAHIGGYFWLSYDSPIFGGVYFDFDNMKYQYNYYYDSDATRIATLKVHQSYVQAANIYRAVMGTSKKQEVLSAVNIGLGDANGRPTTTDFHVTIDIYKNLKNINPGNINDPKNIPIQGNPARTIKKFYPFSGAYTIDLGEPLLLENGEWFSIVVKVENKDHTASIRCSKEPNSSNNDLSYYYKEGSGWISTKEGDGVNAVARIKGYTNLVDRREALADHLKNANIFVNGDSFTYDGCEKVPKVTVMFDGKSLVENNDYKLAYANNILPGKARIFVAGKGKYEGQVVEKNFLISKCQYPIGGDPHDQFRYYIYRNDINSVGELPLPDGWRFDNPSKSINELRDGENGISITYTAFDKNCYEVLDSKIWVYVQGETRERYSGTITSASLEKESYIFGNSPVRPKVTVFVSDNGGVSYKGDEGVQYCVTYENNDRHGTATAIVKGMSSYSGEIRLNFQIVENKKIGLETATLSYESDGHQFVSEPIKPEVKVTLGRRTLQKDVDYLLSYENNDAGGKGSIVVIGIGSYEGVKTGTFNIIDASGPSTETTDAVQIEDDATTEKPTMPSM